ncbi:MAG: GFA family protein [Actinobacteria bacterium]|nr:GFA family protein [Actinomycetota bacterium]
MIYCYCRDCRRTSGAPAPLFVGYRTEQVETGRGVPKVYCSSPGVSRSFCADCGTPLSYEDEWLPGEVYAPVRRLRRPGALRARGVQLGLPEARTFRHPRRSAAPPEEQQAPVAASGSGLDLSERSWPYTVTGALKTLSGRPFAVPRLDEGRRGARASTILSSARI